MEYLKRLLFVYLAICLSGSNMLFSQGTAVCKNIFDGGVELAPSATIPKINDISILADADTGSTATDRSGKLLSLNTEAEDEGPVGYPKPVVFRQDTPDALEADKELIRMVVSDHHIWVRKYGHEAFAEQFPGKSVLVHQGDEFMAGNGYSPKQMMQDRGLLNGDMTERWIQIRGGYREVVSEDFFPFPDFLGYWVYEAGVNASAAIADQQRVTVVVADPARFEPRIVNNPMRARLRDLTGDDKVPRIVLICPRDGEGELDWLHAELGEVISTHNSSGTIVVRRFNTGKGFPSIPAGAYIAAHVPTWDNIKPWVYDNLPESHPFHFPVWQFFWPNFSPLCPVDPRNGLNAAQWFARHYIEKKKTYYPHSGGYALDVSSSTHFPFTRHSDVTDLNNDGIVDKGFIDGVSWWALGMHDFVYYMREGVEGVFEGMGDDLLVAWDATDNDDQRLFHLINGAEFEHTMIHGVGWGPMQHLFSSNLDRLLLWGERAREPNITFISNKYPDEAYHGGTLEELLASQQARPNQSLQYMRLDLASACMTTGYFHSSAGRGNPSTLNLPSPRLQTYDEYYCGAADNYNWLGQPLGAPVRYLDHLGAVLYAYTDATPLPQIIRNDLQWNASAERMGSAGFRLTTESTGAYVSHEQSFTLGARLPLGEGIDLVKMEEYTVSFNVRGSSPYGHIDERFRPIPNNISMRFRVNDQFYSTDSPNNYKSKGYYQECLVFEEDRKVHLTLQAPESGKGVLEICISEVPGTVEITNLEIRRGCGDVLYREFENGLAVLNGSSTSSVELPMSTIFQGQGFRRIEGTQDPQHNNGQLVGNSLMIPARDGYLLVRETTSTSSIDVDKTTSTGNVSLYPNPAVTMMHVGTQH